MTGSLYGVIGVGGGGGGFSSADQTVTVKGTATVSGSAAASLQLTGLDLDTDGHYKIECKFINAAGGLLEPKLMCNGDTTDANYYVQWNGADGAGAENARYNIPLLKSSAASVDGYYTIDMVKYSSSYKPRAVCATNTKDAAAVVDGRVSWMHNSTTNVTSIELVDRNGNSYFDVGTTFTVYTVSTS